MTRAHALSSLLFLGTLTALAGCDARSSDPVDSGLPTLMGSDAGTTPGTDAGTAPGTDAGPTATPGSLMPGAACGCDSECSGTSTHPGLCVEGICMQRASAACASAGSSAECPTGSRCWGYEGVTGGICWPDCSAHTCAGTCDSDGSCVANESSTCTASCSEVCSRLPPCTPGSCGSGLVCDTGSGECVIDLGSAPPGPVPTCAAGVGSVPDWRCTGGATYCGELVPFDPPMGTGYWNYPLNGETESNQYRSFIRRDVMMLVKYAAAMVACQATGWSFGNGGPLGLGDMSEADGAIPGTSIGSPGHPAGTHVDGHDMDIAYYQTGTANNQLRAICEHTSGGSDAYHCTGAPTLLDTWRTALFIGHMHASPNLRVIGVDGRVGPLVESAITQLCGGGWLSGDACSSPSIAYEVTDTGRYWYLFHHHHMHISVNG